MKNVKLSTKKNTLVITMDITAFTNKTLTADDLSKTGKSYVIAGTEGFVKLEGTVLEGLNLSLNLNASRKAYDAHMNVLDAQATVKEVKAERSEQQALAEQLSALPADTLKALLQLATTVSK